MELRSGKSSPPAAFFKTWPVLINAMLPISACLSRSHPPASAVIDEHDDAIPTLGSNDGVSDHHGFAQIFARTHAAFDGNTSDTIHCRGELRSDIVGENF